MQTRLKISAAVRGLLRGEMAWRSLRQLAWLIVLFGGGYGATMGAYSIFSGGRSVQIFFSAIKVPMLLGVSFALSVPSFFVMNTLMGLRGDFGQALRAVTAAQAGLAITLASLAPFTALWYASCPDYQACILFNGVMFAVATTAGQVLLRRFYRKLIAGNSRHRLLLRAWTVVYSFIAIQMAWTLRPFVGNPAMPAHFFRPGAWGNAYVIVGDMIWKWIRTFVAQP